MTKFYSFTKQYPTSPPDKDTASKIIALAKAINAGTSENHASKASWYEVMKRLAEQNRRAGQTEAQAFAEYVQTEDGRELFKAYRSASGPDFHPMPAEIVVPIAKADSAYGKLKKFAADLRAQQPELTEHQAFAAVFSDPKHRELAELSKRESASA